ncbi:MAG: bifunctional transcriptional activator/DNA repair protein Ada [Idiomarina sp.]|nr:bifunctional transcriptional activator/DNA repair protein Ada [Idiomarina sp.]
MNTDTKQRYYQALLSRDASYSGVFFVGITTTGIFCHATCPARKPKFDHCEFFLTAKEALIASYRPCKRCKPLSPPNQTSDVIKRLIEAVEENPDKRWRDSDFKALGVDESTARRQFKKRLGMTFVEYARARRIGLATQQIRAGQPVIDAQLNAGYESASGFRDAFFRTLGTPPSKQPAMTLFASWLDTPLGPMLAIADHEYLYLLEFADRRALEREIERLRLRLKAAVVPGKTLITNQIESELEAYFVGSSLTFNTPCHLVGSEFEKTVWAALRQIPVGQTTAYLTLADNIGRRTAFRAVANANGKNQLAIIIPCHRVINTNGQLGGYGGGLERKRWLIEHERQHEHK